MNHALQHDTLLCDKLRKTATQEKDFFFKVTLYNLLYALLLSLKCLRPVFHILTHKSQM